MAAPMNPTPILAGLVAVVVAFLAGYGVAGLPDAPPARVVEVEVPAGQFDDVPLTMRSGTGATFRYLCDMSFTAEGDTARCSWQEP